MRKRSEAGRLVAFVFVDVVGARLMPAGRHARDEQSLVGWPWL
jgi:hypothetical protein